MTHSHAPRPSRRSSFPSCVHAELPSPLFSDLLLACNGARGTFARACVGVSALTADRQPFAMTQPAIAAEIHQPLDVHRYLAAQIAFHDVVVVDGLANLDDFVFRQIADPAIGGDAYFRADVLGVRRTDAVNVTKRDFHAFIGRNVDPGDARHGDLLAFNWPADARTFASGINIKSRREGADYRDG